MSDPSVPPIPSELGCHTGDIDRSLDFVAKARVRDETGQSTDRQIVLPHRFRGVGQCTQVKQYPFPECVLNNPKEDRCGSVDETNPLWG
jgi:hypothetical protein